MLVLGQYIDIPIYWSSYVLDTSIDTARWGSIYCDIAIIETRMRISSISQQHVALAGSSARLRIGDWLPKMDKDSLARMSATIIANKKRKEQAMEVFWFSHYRVWRQRDV